MSVCRRCGLDHEPGTFRREKLAVENAALKAEVARLTRERDEALRLAYGERYRRG